MTTTGATTTTSIKQSEEGFEKWKKETQFFLEHLMLGGISGTVTKTVVAPLERIKIVLQVQDSSKHFPPGGRYNGIIDAAVRINREQGFWSFWRGNWTNAVVRYFPTQALGFAFDSRIRNTLINKEVKYANSEYLLRSLASGALSGAVSQCFVYPLDFARTRLTADVTEKGKPVKYKGAWDCMRQVAKNEGGLPALYKGFAVSLFGTVFYKGIYFGGYDALKHFYFKKDQKQSLMEKWAIGQIVTTAAQYASYPPDSVRRRLMMRGTGSDALYKNAIDCTKVIWKTERFTGFFKGALANTFRGIGGALGLVMYDYLTDYLNARVK
jgi:solute carrier family 25 (adenine nucleotide translocator) protein 4/5/6/31